MAIDVTQFYQTFFEESLEGLGQMESILLRAEQNMSGATDGDVLDKESLNTIFRVVHSIKGGGGTFGFIYISDFSHVLETLLDEIRDNRSDLNRKTVNLLLKGVDALRALFSQEQDQKTIDTKMVHDVFAQLEKLQLNVAPEKKAKGKKVEESSGSDTNIRIDFKPYTSLFMSGNDPLRLLNELSDLGKIKIKPELKDIPEWSDMDPEKLYMQWSIDLQTRATEDQVRAVFEWVTDHCDLSIKALTNETEKNTSDKTGSIRVSVPKVDALVDLVGELVITQTMLSQLTNNFTLTDIPKLQLSVNELERHIRELQERVMSIRMLPIGYAFHMLPRTVRDFSKQLGKKIKLHISGEHTELDKTVIERLNDPLLHIVRNCIDHGIELPNQRKKLGKPESGVIDIQVSQKAGNVVVEISDDGQGLQEEKIYQKAMALDLIDGTVELTKEKILELIFLPGFSTVDHVSDLSGRGVGMDVVRNNIRSLGGSIEINSDTGVGTKITIRMPLTLAIMDGLNAQVGQQVYIFPLISIIESVNLQPDRISKLAGGPDVVAWRDEFLPLIRLHEIFKTETTHDDITFGTFVIIESEGKKAAIYVDELLGQQQVVIKSLEMHYHKIDGIAAATIMGDGVVALILDVSELIVLAHSNPNSGFSVSSSVPDQTQNLNIIS